MFGGVAFGWIEFGGLGTEVIAARTFLDCEALYDPVIDCEARYELVADLEATYDPVIDLEVKLETP